MLSIFESNKAQAGGMGMIMGLMFLVMTIVVLSAFIPVIQSQINSMRGQDDLNCISSKNICGGAGDQTRCYNSSKDSETTSCLIFDIYLPYIIIAVLIGGVAALFMRPTPQPQYPGY